MSFLKKTLAFWISFIFIAVISVNPVAMGWTQPAVPTLHNDNPNGAEGDWYNGAIPPNYDPSKPVLVFVQGMGQSANSWWGATEYYGNNDMYAYAYNSGYRTAFVNFRDADGNKASMWQNGSVLQVLLGKICNYYGVSKVNLICHSKGGIDSQSAIVHYGAYVYVDKVFTLSSPHWGSQLADLSYSWYAWWLGDLMGSHDDGTYVLQTGYMNSFRSETDNRTENNGVTYYTGAGSNWGPLFSALWFGGSYLGVYGSNDGLVTVSSAQNPRGTHIFTANLNHDNIRIGNKVWSYVEPRVRSISYSPAERSSLAPISTDNALNLEESAELGGYQVQGGLMKDTKELSVLVESDVHEIVFDLLVSNPQTSVEINSPDGQQYKPEQILKDNTFFAGATHLLTSIKRPTAGRWRVKVLSKKQNGYLLLTRFESPWRTRLKTESRSHRSNRNMNVAVLLDSALKGRLRDSKLQGALWKVSKRNRNQKVKDIALEGQDSDAGYLLALPDQPGLYNITLSIEGVLDDGTPFLRNHVRSFIVESEDPKGTEFLRKLEKE